MDEAVREVVTYLRPPYAYVATQSSPDRVADASPTFSTLGFEENSFYPASTRSSRHRRALVPSGAVVPEGRCGDGPRISASQRALLAAFSALAPRSWSHCGILPSFGNERWQAEKQGSRLMCPP